MAVLRIITVMLIFLPLSVSKIEAHSKWINFTNTDDITSIAVRTTDTLNELWLGVRGGVIRYDLDTDQKIVYTRADGLATNDILSVTVNHFSDKLSVWAGGSFGYGISEFDGTQWITYNVSPSIWDDRYKVFDMAIEPAVVGSSGRLWLSTLVGGAMFNLPIGNWTALSDGGLDVALDTNNTPWYGSYEGLKHLENGSWTTFDTSNSGIASNSVRDVAVDHQNRVWTANNPDFVSGEWIGGGISLFDGTDWTVFDPSNTSMPSTYVYLIAVDSDDNIWAVDWSLGSPHIMKYDGNEWTFYDTTNSPIPKEGSIRNLASDKSGNIYFATGPVLIIDRGPVFRGGGEVLKFDGSVWSTLSVKSNGLPYSAARTIAEDQSGNIWFGTMLNGIAMFDGLNWYNFDVTNTPLFESNSVNDIGVDNDGVLWFTGNGLSIVGSGGGGGSFEGGVTSFDGNEWRTYNTSNSGLMDNNVSSVAIDQNNNKWFSYLSYLSKGVSRFDGTTWAAINTSNSGLASDTVATIAVDSEGSVWFGHSTSGKGVSKFDGNSWSIYNTANSGLCDDIVRDIDVGSDGTIWFLVNSGHDSKVCRYDGTDWETYAIPLFASRGDAALSITVEVANKIWVGTYGDGALSFDGTDWITYDVKNSQIGYQFIVDIFMDSRGNKWFASQDIGGGVSVFNENGVTIGIEDPRKLDIPENFALLQNYPNPFNSTTKIDFTLPKGGMTRLAVYNLLGREVDKLIDEYRPAGTYQINWNASDVASGIYFYRLQAGEFVETKKMLLLK